MRAWTCHGRNQQDLVDRLRQANIVKTPAVQMVLEKVDRLYYCPHDDHPSQQQQQQQQQAYQDAPQPIGRGQTISAPHMHAHALEELYPYLWQRRQKLSNEQPLKVLDVGCGSGYLTACLGRWLQSTSSAFGLGPGHVFGMDIHSFLVEQTRHNLQKRDGDLLLLSGDHFPVVQLQVANGWDGWPNEAPFDAIHVGAAAETFPLTLARQLQPDGGVMIVPIASSLDSTLQYLYRIERLSTDDETPIAMNDNKNAAVHHVSYDPREFRVTQLLGVRYVPLVQPPSLT